MRAVHEIAQYTDTTSRHARGHCHKSGHNHTQVGDTACNLSYVLVHLRIVIISFHVVPFN